MFSLAGLQVSNNHVLGLFSGILGWIFAWYSLVLVTADVTAQQFPITPTRDQYWGILFAVILGLVSWLQRMFAIQGDTSEQGSKKETLADMLHESDDE